MFYLPQYQRMSCVSQSSTLLQLIALLQSSVFDLELVVLESRPSRLSEAARRDGTGTSMYCVTDESKLRLRDTNE